MKVWKKLVSGMALPLMLSLLFVRCINDERTMEMVGKEDLVEREEALGMLQTGVLLNYSVCPTNYYPALYAIEGVIPREVNQPLYIRSSIEFCTTALAATPCGMDPTDQSVLTNLYRAVLRGCGPKTPKLLEF